MFCPQKIFLKCLLKSERLVEFIEQKIITSIEILAFKTGSKIMFKAAESWNKLYVSFLAYFIAFFCDRIWGFILGPNLGP